MGQPIGIHDSVGLPQSQAPVREEERNQEARGTALIVAAALLEGSLLLLGLLWLVHVTAGPPSRVLIAGVVGLAILTSTAIVLALTRRAVRQD